MTLLESKLSDAFLAQYRRLLGTIAARPLKSVKDYNEARNKLYKNGINKSYIFDASYEETFICAVRNAIYGMFIYAKKYRNGYSFKSMDNAWFFIKALTTPLEEMIPDWCVIDTAILPYGGFMVCDGLIAERKVFIGPNMVAEMIQELKIERKKSLSGR